MGLRRENEEKSMGRAPYAATRYLSDTSADTSAGYLSRMVLLGVTNNIPTAIRVINVKIGRVDRIPIVNLSTMCTLSIPIPTFCVPGNVLFSRCNATSLL